jgi:hypothetical protein
VAKVGVVLAQIKDPTNETKAFVLDGLRTSDRPAALGYYLLNALREWHSRFGHFPVVTLKMGLVEHADLRMCDTRTTVLNDDWFGRLYELTLAVERNDPGLLGNATPEDRDDASPE